MQLRSSYEKIIPPLLVVLVTAAVYMRVVGHEFLAYDDPVNIYENPYVLRGSATDFLHFWKAPYEKLYIPVTYNLWALLAKAAQWFPPDAKGRINPGVFHGANLLVHLLNALLVQAILARLLKERRAALVGALLFALHPVQVSPVAWISGFRGVLSAFWGLLAFHQYLLHCQSASPDRHPYSHYLWATGFFILALLSKPTAMVIAAMAGLAGYLILNRPLARLARELAPWFLLALATVFFTRFSQPPVPYAFNPSFGQRILIGGDALSFYFYKFLLPLKLGPDYGRTPQFVLGQSWIWFTGLAPYLLLTLLAWKGRRPWLFAGGVFLAGLAPTLGFVSFDFQIISTVSDRFLYLAMLGPAFAAGLLFTSLPGRKTKVVLLTLLVLLGVKSFIQVGYWENGFSLYKEALRVNPRSWLAHNNLGLKYLRNGEPEKAVGLFRKAIEIRPLNAKAYNNLALALEALGQPEEAINYYQKALELAPKSHKIAANLGVVYRGINDFPDALKAFEKSVAVKPDFAEGYNEMGDLYSLMGKPSEAMAAFQRAIEIKPDYAAAYSNLGKLQADLNHPEAAIPLLNKALSLDGKSAETAFNLGVVYENIDDDEAATLAFQRALQIRPGYDQPWLGLGRIYFRASLPQQAIEAYNMAINNNPRLAEAYLDLADLYVLLGQDQEAETVLLRLTTVSPDFAPAYQQLGEIQEHLGFPEAAKNYFNKAKALGQSPDGLSTQP